VWLRWLTALPACLLPAWLHAFLQVNAPLLDQGSPFSEMDFGMDTTNIAEEAQRLMHSLAGLCHVLLSLDMQVHAFIAWPHLASLPWANTC